MFLTAAEKEKKAVILDDIEDAAAFLIYLAGGCKCHYPGLGPTEYWGEVFPYRIAWIWYLIGVALIAFVASRTVCITSKTVSIGYLGGIISRQYRWDEILFCGTWQSPRKTQYVYLSTGNPKHMFLLESMKQCHLPYSKELFALVSQLKNGSACSAPETERMTEEGLRKNRRNYYQIRFIGTAIPVLFSLVIMFSDSFAVWCVGLVVGMLISIFYQLAFESVLSKLEAEYYNDFIADQLSQ